MPILIYHNIVKDGEETSSMSITESKFEKDIKSLADRGYEFLLPSDLVKEDFTLPKKAVMISFDDGYRSNYEIAFPILKKYGAKAEISVITQMINEDRDMFCTWDMLRDMANSAIIEIGSHTHNLHNPGNGGNYIPGEKNGIQRLDGESDADFKGRVFDDIKLSYKEIEENLGVAPLVFTYPYGEYDKDADVVIEELFSLSFGTKPGRAKVINGLYKLPRFEVYEDTDIKTFLK